MATKKTVKKAQEVKGNTAGLRAGAIISWIAAIVMEVMAIMSITGKFVLPFFKGDDALLYSMIAFLVVDLILVILGSRLWVAANHKNAKVRSWIVDNLGVVMAVIAFAPFIVILLTNKETDKRTKTIGTAVAAVALLVAGFGSADYNRIDENSLEVRAVCWTEGGKKYHLTDNCSTLSNSKEVTVGTLVTAKEAGKEDLCKVCANKDAKLQEEGSRLKMTDETNLIQADKVEKALEEIKKASKPAA